MKLLNGIEVVNLAVNLPGPAAARRLHKLGAHVVKVEPPGGDPMSHQSPDWYKKMAEGQEIVTIDLRYRNGQQQFGNLVQSADLLITANRPAVLNRLGLGWDELHRKFPNLCQVAIVECPPPQGNEPGHDLTYQAKIDMPRTLIADMAGAEMAASQALAVLLAKQRGQEAGYATVALSEAADYMGEPFKVGITAEDGVLGGGLPEYNLYETSDGWIAVAALELHFKRSMEKALNIEPKSPDELRPIFKQKSSVEWEDWAKNLGLPISALK